MSSRWKYVGWGPTTPEKAYRRASGRRYFNKLRQRRRDRRLFRVSQFMVVYEWPKRGSVAAIAREMGLNPGLVSRYCNHVAENGPFDGSADLVEGELPLYDPLAGF